MRFNIENWYPETSNKTEIILIQWKYIVVQIWVQFYKGKIVTNLSLCKILYIKFQNRSFIRTNILDILFNMKSEKPI